MREAPYDIDGPLDGPPIVFVHGNGDTAALWTTTIWRFESNGWPRERLHAIDLGPEDVAAAVLMLRPEALAGAVLLRPMMPLRAAPAAKLDGKPVLLLSGAMDPIASEDSTARLVSVLGAGGARVEHRELPAGHELSQADIAAARGWLASAVREPAIA